MTRVALLSSLFAMGCASTRYDVTTTAKEAYWHQGSHVGVVKNDRVAIEASPVTPVYQYDPSFVVRVMNLSSEPMDVVPNQFQLAGPAVVGGMATPYDPEKGIRSADEEHDRLRPTGLDVAVKVMDGVSSMNPKETESQRKAREEREKDDAERERQMAEARSRRMEWEFHLRRTTVRPGESVSGRVKFDAELKPGDLELRYLPGSLPVTFKVQEIPTS
jgi:hypothetical protein